MIAAPSPSKALRRIFLTVFLRGRSARGLQKDNAPKSIGAKLAWTLFFYALFGCFSIYFSFQSVFALSVYLHASTLMFIGMFVASSAGEALFNKEEADILLHRPVTPRALLWAKFSVIVQISLWLAGAFNLSGFIAGGFNAGWRFPLAHAASTVMVALFCVGLVVVTYQLCLHWFGRERLDGLITTMQTIMSILIVIGSQLGPQFLMRTRTDLNGMLQSKWIFFLPPAWFAGFDDALAGSHSGISWIMAALAVTATGVVLWAGFGTLARDYAAGLQTLQETTPNKTASRARGRFLERLVNAPPLRWWLRDSITRAAFLLSTSYLARDRDVKLRVFPGLAPMLMMPIIFLMPNRGDLMRGGFGIAFVGAYLGLLPMIGIGFLKYSQQWAAADIFRAAPIAGPAPLCHGARKAMIFIIVVPIVIILAIVAIVFGFKPDALKMLLPGIIIFPVLAMIPCVSGEAVPLSEPPEEAKQAGRTLQMFGVMALALAIAAAAVAANGLGFFWWFLGAEAVMAALIHKWMRFRCSKLGWSSIENPKV